MDVGWPIAAFRGYRSVSGCGRATPSDRSGVRLSRLAHCDSRRRARAAPSRRATVPGRSCGFATCSGNQT
jgi:hypothetical protein